MSLASLVSKFCLAFTVGEAILLPHLQFCCVLSTPCRLFNTVRKKNFRLVLIFSLPRKPVVYHCKRFLIFSEYTCVNLMS